MPHVTEVSPHATQRCHDDAGLRNESKGSSVERRSEERPWRAYAPLIEAHWMRSHHFNYFTPEFASHEIAATARDPRNDDTYDRRRGHCADSHRNHRCDSFAPPDSYDLYHAARRERSIIIGEAIARAIVAVGATVREAFARYRKRRQAAATYAMLRELDDHMLHDLGFDRRELSSAAAESAVEIERTRVGVLPQS
jgi:uncharacterized protein YjiS (DUF1127 family)